jgi:hypothetical protein
MHIILRALSDIHIEESIRNTYYEKKKLVEILKEHGFQEADMSYFCKKLFFYTGGIPRLVCRVCLSIINNSTIQLQDRDAIDSNFRNNNFNLINVSPEIYLLEKLEQNSKLARIFSIVYALNALGITFPEDSVIGGFKSFSEVLHSLPLYIDKCDDFDKKKVVYRVLFPECIVHNMTQPLVIHFNLLNGLQKFATVLNSGELLEYLTTNTIILRILILKNLSKYELKWKQVSKCFAESNHISELEVDMNLSEIIFLPKFTTKKESSDEIKLTLKSLPWSHDASIEEWNWIVPNLFKVKHFHKPKPMSMSCDLYYYANNNIMMGFAMKNYGSKTDFNISILQNEIDKAAVVMKNTCIKNFSLFILCRHHTTLQTLFVSKDVYRIDPGIFEWSENELKQVDNGNITYKSIMRRLKKKNNMKQIYFMYQMEWK